MTDPSHAGPDRLNPHWWDPSRHVLVQLRRAIEGLIREHRLAQPGSCIVDIGCGRCPYRPLFEASGCRYVGCDIAEGADVTFEPGQRIDLPDASADGVVSFQVLEHVWDIDWYLGECRRLLRPGGWLLLSTHGTWLYHPHPTDFRRWTRDGLCGELQHRGLAVEAVRGVVGPLAWSTLVRLAAFDFALRRVPLLSGALFAATAVLMNLRMALEDAVTPAASRERNACVYVTLSRKPDCPPG